MTDAISNYGRRAQSDPSLRSALDKTDRKASSLAKALEDVSTSTPAPKAAVGDQVHLNPRKIAESFHAIEQMIRE